MKRIIIETIPHKEQRYETVGDYYEKNGKWYFKISDYGDPDLEFLTLIHELIEWHLTQRQGITEEVISKFDMESGLDDPGASEISPYHKEHVYAENIERLLCQKLGIEWDYYSKVIDKL